MTYILFDLHGTLVDSQRMRACSTVQLGQVMAARFGGEPQAWADANRRILEDWDSYYADLDLNGEHGLDDLREGEFRTTRALFRLAKTPEPERETLLALARDLPYLMTRRCDAFYDDSKPVLEHLHTAGYILGIACHATSAQVRGTLEGGGMESRFQGIVITPDVTGRFTRDRQFFLAARVPPGQCTVVDDQTEGIEGAHAAGMRTVQLLRTSGEPSPMADHVLYGDLRGLLGILES